LICRHNRSEYGFAVSDAVNIEALYEHAALADDDELTVRGASHALGNRLVVANKHYDRRGTIRTLAIDVGTVTAWPHAGANRNDSAGNRRLASTDVWQRRISGYERQALDRHKQADDP
jgi:hypothetical protein